MDKNNRKIVTLSWYPANSRYYTAGGLRRFAEIAKRTPVPVVIIDRYPSIFRSLASSKVEITEYGKIFDPRFLTAVHPIIYYLAQRVISVFQILIRLLILKPKPEIIYVPFSEHVHLTLAAILAKLFFNSKVVLCNLNTNIFFAERLLNKFLHSFADKIITISNSLKDDLARTGIYASFVNGVGFNNPKLSKITPVKKYDAIFIGRHTPDKGIFDLLEIWRVLKNKYRKSLSLVTIGNTPDIFKLELEQRIRKYQLGGNIKILGEVSETEKIEYLTQSKVMVFPSRQEGWGIAPMEALSLRLPVVAYNLPVYKESIGENDAFRTVDIGNIEKFAKVVIDTLNNLEKYSHYASEWKPQTSWNEIAKQEWKIISSD